LVLLTECYQGDEEQLGTWNVWGERNVYWALVRKPKERMALRKPSRKK